MCEESHINKRESNEVQEFTRKRYSKRSAGIHQLCFLFFDGENRFWVFLGASGAKGWGLRFSKPEARSPQFQSIPTSYPTYLSDTWRLGVCTLTIKS